MKEYKFILGNLNNHVDAYSLVEEFLNESSYSIIDIERLNQTIDQYLRTPEKIVIFVYQEGSGPIGLIAGQITHSPFTNELTASEQVFYIKKEHRGTKLAIKLFLYFEAWAEQKGASKITMTSLASSPSSLDNFYTKLGFSLAEKAYIKEL